MRGIIASTFTNNSAFMGVIFPILEKIRQWVSILAFYFGVFLPALPYITFFTVVIGWVLSVIQTALVSPIWMLMHMQPEQSFVGSQRQGYLMLMSLFVRPMLALIGLFAAILVSDPVITYVTDAFFSMREALVTGGGTISTFSQVWQTFWWIGLYAAVLLPILYMIFGLAQSMPDEILRWVGGGIGSLGETNANSGIVGAMDSFGKSGGTAGAARDAAAKGMRAAKLQKERAAKAAEKGGQANGGSTRADSTLHPQQGVTPTGGGTGVVDVGQGAGKGFGGGRMGSRDGRFSGKQGAQQDVTDVEFREVKNKEDKTNPS